MFNMCTVPWTLRVGTLLPTSWQLSQAGNEYIVLVVEGGGSLHNVSDWCHPLMVCCLGN